jgi:hypothetical protein
MKVAYQFKNISNVFQNVIDEFSNHRLITKSRCEILKKYRIHSLIFKNNTISLRIIFGKQ